MAENIGNLLISISIIILPLLVLVYTTNQAIKHRKGRSVGKQIASWISPIIFALVSIASIITIISWYSGVGDIGTALIEVTIFFFTLGYILIFGIFYFAIKLSKKN